MIFMEGGRERRYVWRRPICCFCFVPTHQKGNIHNTQDLRALMIHSGLRVLRNMNEATRVQMNGLNNYHSINEVQTISVFLVQFDILATKDKTWLWINKAKKLSSFKKFNTLKVVNYSRRFFLFLIWLLSWIAVAVCKRKYIQPWTKDAK